MIPSIDEDVATEEERYDGFYAVCTNLEDDVATIISINQKRWQIEKCFRIMKRKQELINSVITPFMGS